jgi:drug/metabolite transporter (DMT)-like permease
VPVIVSLLAAFAAAALFGVASALQAYAARTEPPDSGVRGLLRVVLRWPYLLGLACDLGGFVAEIVALRGLPLFVVQAAVAGSLAVTAVVAVPLLAARLSVDEWIAVSGVCVGLAAVGFSAGTEGTPTVGPAFRWGLAVATGVLIAAAWAATRLPDRARRPALGLAGGLGFGIVAIAARILPGLAPAHLVRDPAAYLVVVAGVTAFAAFTTALRTGAVAAATAAMVLGESVVPSAVGVLLLGDTTRPGYWPVAAGGFALAVASALFLSRFGEPASVSADVGVR